MSSKTAILLMNVGSPDGPDKRSVRRYLREFLNDKRVIDLPWLMRKVLVNLIIIPFRVKKSTGLYQRLFDEKGAPLVYISEELKSKLQQKLGKGFKVFLGMRYGKPGYKAALQEIKSDGFEKIIVLPLYPQFATSTSESAFAAVEEEVRKQKTGAKLVKIEQFYDHPRFVVAFAERAKKYDLTKYDHVLFSYHGLPNRQVEKMHPGKKVVACDCSTQMPEYGEKCYRAACYATTGLIAGELGLDKKDYTVAFQSRLSKNWLSPFSDDVILEKLNEGKKNILVLAPSFVADCLETIVEIGEDYQKLFRERGGERLQLVESLNTSDDWIEALVTIINENV